MRTAIWAALLLPVVAMAQDTRAPTSAEQKSFETFYHARYPEAAQAPPVLVTRAPHRKEWQFSAHADSAPQRIVLPLCRMQRTEFVREDGAWRERDRQTTLTWINHTPQCSAPPGTPVALRADIPDIDQLRLIQSQNELLQSARLLMAGNTNCAPIRSRNFQLIALDKAKDGLPMLVFESDIGKTAGVSVRKSRADLTAWNVSCAGTR